MDGPENRHPEDVFDAALESLLAGTPIESILAQYPGMAAELEPVLRAAQAARSAPRPELPAASLAAIMARAQAKAGEQRANALAATTPVAIAGAARVEEASGGMGAAAARPAGRPALFALPPAVRSAAALAAALVMLVGALFLLALLRPERTEPASTPEPLRTISVPTVRAVAAETPSAVPVESIRPTDSPLAFSTATMPRDTATVLPLPTSPSPPAQLTATVRPAAPLPATAPRPAPTGTAPAPSAPDHAATETPEPVPTMPPSPTLAPTEEPSPTAAATETPEPEETEEVEETRTPVPFATETAEPTEEPDDTPEPEETQEPEHTPEPEETEEPDETPTARPATRTPETEPTEEPEETHTPEPEETEEPEVTPSPRPTEDNPD
ncbi:MAG TPA: hypothetical protein VFR15_09730 [Chloroflexia bacterium]|nr:hypothetical protein [Chloroflexia bacterium]